MDEPTHGSLLDGRYRVLDTLGAGSQALVVRARDEETDAVVAVKVLCGALAASHEADRRFAREIEICSRILHRDVVRIHRGGRLPSGELYCVMDFVEGRTLESFLAFELPPEERVAGILAVILDALAHVHDHGILHRDLKPANILIRPDGRPILADFGLARDDTMTALTGTGYTVGTPTYMAPEVVFGGQATVRSEVWAVGLMAHEMLAGPLPLEGRNVVSMLGHVACRQIPDLAQTAPHVSPPWRTLVARATAQNPDERFEDTRAFRVALDGVIRALAEPAPPVARQLPPPAPAIRPSTPAAKVKPSTLALAVLALLAGLAWLALRSAGRPDVYDETWTVGSLGFQVSWSSSTPYPSLVEVRSDQGQVRLVRSPDGAAVTDHRLSIPAPGPNSVCHVTVLPPGGRGTTKSLRALPLRLEALETATAGAQARIRLIGGCPLATSLSLLLDDRAIPATRTSSSPPAWTSDALPLPDRILALRARVGWAGGPPLHVDLAPLVLEETRRALASLAGLRPEDLAASLGRNAADEVSRQAAEDSAAGRSPRDYHKIRRRLMGETLVTRLRADAIPQAYQQGIVTAPMAFRCQGVPDEFRRRLYAGLFDVVALTVLAGELHGDGAVPLPLPPLPHLGEYGLGLRPSLTGDSRLGVFVADGPPVPLGPFSHVILGAPAVRLDLHAQIHDASRIASAELAVHATSFDGFMVRVTVNGGAPLVVVDSPVLERAPGGLPRIFHQRIPQGLLVDGDNVIQLVPWALAGSAAGSRTQVRRVELILEREP